MPRAQLALILLLSELELLAQSIKNGLEGRGKLAIMMIVPRSPLDGLVSIVILKVTKR